MKSLVRLAALALALAASAPLAAQERPGAPPGPIEQELMERGADDRPFQLLMEARRELQLTDRQVGRLEAIARQLEARNAPLRRRVWEERQRLVQRRREEIARELEGKSPQERRVILRRLREQGPARQVPPPLRPYVEEMRRNIRTATSEAQKVLTPGQKARARQMLREHQRRVREGRGLGGGRRMGGGRRQGPGGGP